MTLPPASDRLLGRDRAAILAEILATRTAYAPDWLPARGGAGHGLADIVAGHLELLQARLAQVPAHRLAVLLDLLGVSLRPAQGARTHVVLTAVPRSPGGRVPAGTRIGATVAGRDDPVVFETVDPVAISPAAIVEVHSVHPEADSEQDHSTDVLASRPLTLFGDLRAADRELYVGHDELLAFDGRAVVQLELGVGVPAPWPLVLEWSWWDGTGWRAFAPLADSALAAGDDDSYDATSGLTRSGTVRLVAPCATSAPLELDGRSTHWVRGRLTAPLDLPPAAPLPTIDRLRLVVVNEHGRLRVRRTTTSGGPTLRVWWPEAPGGQADRHLVDETSGTSGTGPAPLAAAQSLTAYTGHSIRIGVSPKGARAEGSTPPAKGHPQPVAHDHPDNLTAPVLADTGTHLDVSVQRGLVLDKAIADQRAADLSKAFAPLGPSPVRGTTFLFASATATARPGTRVTLTIERPVTAAEEADQLGGSQAGAVQLAAELLATALTTLEGAGGVSTALSQADATLAQSLPTLLSPAAAGWYPGVRSRISATLQELRTAVASHGTTAAQVDAARGQIAAFQSGGNATNVAQAGTHLRQARPTLASVLVDIADAVGQLAQDPSSLAGPRAGLAAAVQGGDPVAVAAAETVLRTALTALLATAQPWLPAGSLPPIFDTDPSSYVATVTSRLTAAKGSVAAASTRLATAVGTLKDINAANLVAAIVPEASTRLVQPVVAWEYHDGDRWRALGAEGDPQVLSLSASGSIRFTVPDDIADVDVDGDVRRWLRARLAEGSFSNLRFVSWTDTKGGINYLPVVEPRAPMVDRIEVFYRHESTPRDAGAVVAHDNHAWRDLTAAVTWPGPGGTPFTPMTEQAPTLYLGLDGPLPADRVGLWLQLTDPSPWAEPHRPVWEGFTGREWVHLTTDDGTDGLRRSGVVGVVWPGTEEYAGAAVRGALGRTITLQGRGAGLRYRPGELLMLTDVQSQEPVVVDAVTAETVTVRAPLTRAYSGARLAAAPPARFGRPRTWLRAVFDATQPLPRVGITGLAAHAVEVAQVETLHDEVLGSGDGSPDQVLQTRRFPVAGDVSLEVRELEGRRADLDADVLTRTLRTQDVDPQAVRVERDARTGQVTAVWVPWRSVTSLGSAGPTDRVFVLDNASGRVIFGGGGHGRPLPEGRDNVRLRTYRTSAGSAGNVGPHTITSLLSAVAVSEVTNPEAASGGADVEAFPDALTRGPGLLRHRRLALTEQDVEAIALEASPAVVRARALGAVDRYGRPLPGAVRVVVVPRDTAAQPQPGPVLLTTVRAAVAGASPAVAAARVTVEGTVYVPVGVAVSVLPREAREAGEVRERVVRALETFLHPLHGGDSGTGWDFGTDVHVSDLARVLEGVPGVDAVTDLVLARDGTPTGDVVPVPPDHVACAGPLTVRLGRER
ncbi:hypothetical protein [Ornithinimicrobium pekingense]|uniref:Baseplate assembly protein n=1 Tax=Ornithinimicrobium pekingense TaxID=384677 RepID=A0ABQ2F5B6_9MICO|nr:hypothetical protein [Ornithinimicrobium pekingense]GGK63469.1 hypothetical protein GCM10011509_09840 [Ornithinimicrobium pekingense]